MDIDLELQIASQSKQIIAAACILLAVLVLLSIFLRDRVPKLKPWLFGALSATLVIPTIYLVASTIYLNLKSESGGPVHWHAGIEFWACGTELDLRNPSGLLSNKVGTSTYHEHDDKFIHLEGVVMRRETDASLGKFLRVTGGYITQESVGIPLTDDEEKWLITGDKRDGDPQGTTLTTDSLENYITHDANGPVATFTSNKSTCAGQPAEVQVFAHKFDEATNTYHQEKVADPASYVIRDSSALGPPSDCIIVEFDVAKDRTDKLCEQYGVRDKHRCVDFGVKPEHVGSVCDIEEAGAADAKGGF